MKYTKLSAALALTLYTILPQAPVASAEAPPSPSANTASKINVEVALQGYDPVAYFMHRQAIKGDSTAQVTSGGKTYYFGMADHIELFKANPEQYLPQFDGLCAMCLVNGQRIAGDPTQFVVDDNKLYFNSNVATQDAFKKDVIGNIARAQSYYVPTTPASANTATTIINAHKANIADHPTDERIDVAEYTGAGELIFPANVENWVVMGASLGMGYNEQNFDANAPGSFVVVAMEPKAYDYFKKNGHFADGTMFTRSSYEATHRMSTNRAGFVMGDYTATEMHVVDRKRFKDGFNFAIFGPNQKKAAILPDGNGCVSCHIKNGAYEAVFAQFYPTIRHQIPLDALAAAMKQEKP